MLPTLFLSSFLCEYWGRVRFTGCQHLSEIAIHVSGGVVVGWRNCLGEDRLLIDFSWALLYFMSPVYDTPERNVKSFTAKDSDNSTSSKHHYL